MQHNAAVKVTVCFLLIGLLMFLACESKHKIIGDGYNTTVTETVLEDEDKYIETKNSISIYK